MKLTITQRVALWIGSIQAWAALLGSLYLSNVLYFPPCDLCWLQRICFYPLAWIIPVSLARKDARSGFIYALPFAAIGWLLSLYQSLLQWGAFANGGIIPCNLDNPCSVKQINIFGFVTIPFLSFLGFTVILLCLIPLARRSHRAVAAAPPARTPARRATTKRRSTR